jgi:hypothetical protein
MQQLQLWTFVIDLNPRTKNSPTTKKFEAFVARTFAPVDCTRLYP